MAGLRTEYPFVLPKGFVDPDGNVHRDGTMRLATARDELEPLSDPKVKDADDPYLAVIVLSRVVQNIGPVTRLSPRDVEGLFAADLAHLQDVYAAINYGTAADIERLTGTGAGRASGPAPLSAAPDPAPPVAATADADEDDDEVEDAPLRPVPSGRRARIEEVGKSSGRPAGRS